jgi:hypothetical protein
MLTGTLYSRFGPNALLKCSWRIPYPRFPYLLLHIVVFILKFKIFEAPYLDTLPAWHHAFHDCRNAASIDGRNLIVHSAGTYVGEIGSLLSNGGLLR